MGLASPWMGDVLLPLFRLCSGMREGTQRHPEEESQMALSLSAPPKYTLGLHHLPYILDVLELEGDSVVAVSQHEGGSACRSV